MKAVVFHGIGDIRLEDVPDPHIERADDAIARITASAICGTDLHIMRGAFTGMQPGTILGHEAVGMVEEIGPMVRNLEVGDRALDPSTVLTNIEPMQAVLDAYRAFDHRQPGRIKVELMPEIER